MTYTEKYYNIRGVMMVWTFELYGKGKKLTQNLSGNILLKVTPWKSKMEW